MNVWVWIHGCNFICCSCADYTKVLCDFTQSDELNNNDTGMVVIITITIEWQWGTISS